MSEELHMSEDEFKRMMEAATGEPDEVTERRAREEEMERILSDFDHEESVSITVPLTDATGFVEVTERQAFLLMHDLATEFGFATHTSTVHDYIGARNELAQGERQMEFHGMARRVMATELLSTYAWGSPMVGSVFAKVRALMTMYEMEHVAIPLDTLFEMVAEAFEFVLNDWMENKTDRSERLEEVVDSFGGETPKQVVINDTDGKGTEVIEGICEVSGWEDRIDTERAKVDGEYRFDVLCQFMGEMHGMSADEVATLYAEEL